MTRNLRMVTTVILVLAIAFICCACGEKQGNPIRLPDRNEVVSIGVSDGEKLAFSPNTEGEADAFIDEFYSILLDMEVTSKESINDVPVNKDSITIHINCLDNSGTTLFYYRDKGTEYVEQPYQGIYKPAPALGFYITEMLDSSDSTTVSSREGKESNIEISPDASNAVVESKESAEVDTMYDRIPMVMVKGKLYYDTGKVHDGGKCGIMDGEITSSVDGSEIPTEDDQSNFGSGFGYQYGADDTIIVYMNEKWAVFEYRGKSMKK